MKIKRYLYIIIVLLVSCEGNIKKSSISHSNNDSITKHTSSSPTLSSVRKDSFIEKTDVNKTQDNIIFSNIDSVSLAEIKQFVKTKKTIYDYYHNDDESVWSEKMFGRCCTEADLLYSELLEFDITAKTHDETYPFIYLSDMKYRTAYTFKENQNVEIFITLKKESEYHKIQTNLSVEEVLKPQDTILSPFKLSMVNGYVKSEKTFKDNGRVKEMKLFLNNNYKATIILKDTPLIQEFMLNIVFTINDTIKLIPQSYYKGSKYDDICISEIQSSLSQITHPSINKKYVIYDLRR